MLTDVKIIENAIANPMIVSQQILDSGLMGKHPLPYGDPRVRGFVAEFTSSTDDLNLLKQDALPLWEPFDTFRQKDCNLFTIAVNQYPPTDADSFLLKPHIDRRFRNNSFDLELFPVCTSVLFLDFPAQGEGGELVTFPDTRLFDSTDEISRTNARGTVEKFNGRLIAPQPGRACLLWGPVPHAVIGYKSSFEDAWRMVCVFAQFKIPEHLLGAISYRILKEKI